MGMEHTVTFSVGGPSCWPAARELLASCGISIQVRMIDGDLAFPDEEPPESWRELRLGTPEGQVVTLRRDPDRIVLVVWGNADARLIRFWNALTWAFAEAGHGQIHTMEGSHSPAEFGRRVDLPEGLRRSGGHDA
jgi:hypothetical protein